MSTNVTSETTTASTVNTTAAADDDAVRRRMAPLLDVASSSSAISIVETPEFLENAFHQLDQAVLLLPPEETAAYLTAVAKCPELIVREAHPVNFLRCCGWNPWEAAQRWMNYWKLRLQVLGEDRCYRSIFDYSGNGALDDLAIRIYETGLFYSLQLDEQGQHPVLFFDKTKFAPRKQSMWKVTVEDKLRSAFHQLHIPAWQQPHASRHGVVLVQLVTRKDPKIYPAVNSFVGRAMRDCFPYRVHSYHMILAPSLEKQHHSRFVAKIAPYLRQLVERFLYFASVKNIHMALFDSTADKKAHQARLAAIFREKIGIRKDALPPEAGGKWSFARFKRWLIVLQKEQAEILASMPPLPVLTAKTAASSNIDNSNDCGENRTETNADSGPLEARSKKRRHSNEDVLESMPLAKTVR